MSCKKEMGIKTTFTYDEESDEIGWLCPEAHRADKPIIHKNAKVGGIQYDDYCRGRGKVKYSVKLIKEILGGSNERRHIQRLS